MRLAESRSDTKATVMKQRQVFVSPTGERISFPAPLTTTDPKKAHTVLESARCAELDPELFVDDHRGRAQAAIQVCASCEVSALCLEVFGTAIDHGIIGGLTPAQRRSLRADKRRAA